MTSEGNMGFDVEKPLRIGCELSSPKLYIAILRPIDRRGIKVAADQQRRGPIVSFDDIEKVRNLRLPLDWARIALEMHRYESHPNPGNLDLRADRHGCLNPHCRPISPWFKRFWPITSAISAMP